MKKDGIGYQTLLKIWIAERLEEESALLPAGRTEKGGRPGKGLVGSAGFGPSPTIGKKRRRFL